MLTRLLYRRYLHQRPCKRATSVNVRKGLLFRHFYLDRQGRQPTVSIPQGVIYVKGFRNFISRGNLIELAVAVVIGTAFTALVTATVNDLITPLIAAIGGQPDFGNLTFNVHGSTFDYGKLLNAIIS